MNNKLLEAVNSIDGPSVLLVGDFFLDSYVYGDATRISPEAPVPILKVVKRESSCGGAAAVAVDLNALGAKTICLGVVGIDNTGDRLIEMLEKNNADVEGLLRLSDRPTICKERLIGLAQHRHKQQLMRVDDECCEPLNDEQYSELIGRFEEKLVEADIVCIQDYNKGIINEKFCKAVIKKSRKAGKRVLVDPPAVCDYSKFKGASAITPNRQETSSVVGFAIETIDDAKRAAIELKKSLGLEAAIITLDRDGAYLERDGQSKHLPTVARKVYDVTGAGDMVLAAMAASLAGGLDYDLAVEIANIAGGLEVEKFGVASVSTTEIIHEILSRSMDEDSKIQNIDGLLSRLDWHRGKGDKIVFTNGCFDVLHTGHISYLNFCKANGDIVVLGLNSDDSIRRLKGDDRPINCQSDRATVLAALGCVDYIVVFDEDTPARLIEQVCPAVLIKGNDWADKGVVGREFVESRGGKVVLADMVEGKSSTATIEKMKGQ